MQHKRLNHLLNFSESKPHSANFCSLDVSCMAPVMTSAALYWNESSFSLKIHCKVGQRYMGSQKRFVDC